MQLTQPLDALLTLTAEATGPKPSVSVLPEPVFAAEFLKPDSVPAVTQKREHKSLPLPAFPNHTVLDLDTKDSPSTGVDLDMQAELPALSLQVIDLAPDQNEASALPLILLPPRQQLGTAKAAVGTLSEVFPSNSVVENEDPEHREIPIFPVALAHEFTPARPASPPKTEPIQAGSVLPTFSRDITNSPDVSRDGPIEITRQAAKAAIDLPNSASADQPVQKRDLSIGPHPEPKGHFTARAEPSQPPLVQTRPPAPLLSSSISESEALSGKDERQPVRSPHPGENQPINRPVRIDSRRIEFTAVKFGVKAPTPPGAEVPRLPPTTQSKPDSGASAAPGVGATAAQGSPIAWSPENTAVQRYPSRDFIGHNSPAKMPPRSPSPLVSIADLPTEPEKGRTHTTNENKSHPTQTTSEKPISQAGPVVINTDGVDPPKLHVAKAPKPTEQFPQTGNPQDKLVTHQVQRTDPNPYFNRPFAELHGVDVRQLAIVAPSKAQGSTDPQKPSETGNAVSSTDLNPRDRNPIAREPDQYRARSPMRHEEQTAPRPLSPMAQPTAEKSASNLSASVSAEPTVRSPDAPKADVRTKNVGGQISAPTQTPTTKPVSAELPKQAFAMQFERFAKSDERPVLEAAATAVSETARADFARQATEQRIIRHIPVQLIEAFRLSTERPVEIALNPEELGRVRMMLITTEGSIQIALTAERADTLDLMRRNIDQLTDEFRDLGYENINFSFGNGNDNAEQEDQRYEMPDENLAEVSRLEDLPAFTAQGNAGIDIRI